MPGTDRHWIMVWSLDTKQPPAPRWTTGNARCLMRACVRGGGACPTSGWARQANRGTKPNVHERPRTRCVLLSKRRVGAVRDHKTRLCKRIDAEEVTRHKDGLTSRGTTTDRTRAGHTRNLTRDDRGDDNDGSHDPKSITVQYPLTPQPRNPHPPKKTLGDRERTTGVVYDVLYGATAATLSRELEYVGLYDH